ncbi:hypothetical protein GCM10009122_41990 [Fulvivirga kasyanovii]|uniref:transposase n=1 Tax=Fulvivirga kasyanovii TaxID=396812 RepID=UPI0012BCFFE2
MNLRDALQKTFYKQSRLLKDSFNEFRNPDQKSETAEAVQVDDNNKGDASAMRQYKFEKAKKLHLQGYKIKAIARILGAGHKTIKKYIQLDMLPSRQPPLNYIRQTNFMRFTGYLLKECGSDVSYRFLFGAVKQQGYNGSYSQFCKNMSKLIQGEVTSHQSREKILSIPKLASIQTWSTSKLAFMALRERDSLHLVDQEFLDFLYAKSPQIKEDVALAIRFKNLFKNKREGNIEEWLTDVLHSRSGLTTFAKGIKGDFEAVNQAVVSNISNGQVEGQINRLKNIKRRMYGGAGFPLLRNVVLFQSG